MKKILMLTLLMTTANAFGQSFIEGSLVSTLSPLASATLVIDAITITVQYPFAATSARTQQRGMAGKEQLRDDLVKLDEQMISGMVRTIEEVKQPALKELFLEIAADKEHMLEINTAITSGSELHRIATAVAVSLMIGRE